MASAPAGVSLKWLQPQMAATQMASAPNSVSPKWLQPQIRRPREACGAVEKERSLVRGGVLKSSFQELGARGAGVTKGQLATLGRPPGSPGGCAIRCSPHARERCTRGLGDLWIAQDAPPVLRSGRLRALRGLDTPRIEQSCEPTCIFRGRRQWPQAISHPPTPRGVWGQC